MADENKNIMQIDDEELEKVSGGCGIVEYALILCFPADYYVARDMAEKGIILPSGQLTGIDPKFQSVFGDVASKLTNNNDPTGQTGN